jgi:cellulose synthase/poly-beta-1,6-N-acetylglucosamine synthase-like glycosyltransferase
MILLLITSGNLLWYLVSTMQFNGFNLLLLVALASIALIELIRILQSFTLLAFALAAKDPVPMQVPKGLRVAVMTTIVPSKEPFDMVAQTLLRMKEIDPGEGNTLDVWLLDEGDDPYVRARCEAMGVKHFSRKGVKKWNTDSGTFKARTKHGNHNAWRAQNEEKYDVVAQMDPDHVPRPEFLTRTLGYFADPDVAFVVAPQVYGNINKNWIARAAAFQAYVFHGIIQRGANGLNAPLLIGTNHLYRTSAFKQIGGYQDSIIEDHLTSMKLYGTVRKNGGRWKGVYTPDILAVGEGPTSFTDFFNQQKRWAYGIWEILQKHSGKDFRLMTRRQALSFAMLQFFYPSVAVAWLLSFITAVLIGSMHTQFTGSTGSLGILWLTSVASSFALFYWLRRFNLAEHERKDWGLAGMSLLLMCIPVYVAAGWRAIMRKPLRYAVTAKGKLTSADNLQTFSPHLLWLLGSAASLAAMAVVGSPSIFSSVFWVLEHAAICAAPILIFAVTSFRAMLRTVLQLIGKTHLPYMGSNA